jgi:hypothetical protein
MASKRVTKRYYVGVKGGPKFMHEVFLSAKTPIAATHGKKYLYVIGPFRTKAGAMVMAGSGSSPLVQTVADAERIAARQKAKAGKK